MQVRPDCDGLLTASGYNLFMRLAMFILLVALCPPGSAIAAEGFQGRVSTSITLSQSFMRAADPYNRSGLDLDSITIPPVTGMIYVSADKLRLDMTTPGGTVTTLCDAPGCAYVLDHNKKVAHRMLKRGSGDDLPLFSLDQLASDWDVLGDRLAATPGTTVSHLGSKTVNGERCRGIRIRGDISRLLAADEVQVAPGLPSLYGLRGEWRGTFWISERLGLPMKITTSYSGLDLVWQIAGLAAGEIPDALFALPPGYRVVDVPAALPAGPRDA